MLHRLLPTLLIIAVITTVVLNFQSIRREIVYKLHISGDPTTSCCSAEEALKSNGNFNENATTAIFDNQVVNYPKTSLSVAFQQAIAESQNTNTQVLGTTTADGAEKWIDVNLTTEQLTAYEGNKVVMQFPISSGKWGPTPEGTFNIWSKTRSQSMIGGSQELGTYYNLPNVPDNMFFFSGFALHGAYWHNNFGHPMSHGCVNEPLANAHQIFEWAGPIVPPGQNAVRATPENPGTRVVIHS